MKTIVLLALAFLAALPVVHAQDATLGGKWTTEGDSSTQNAGGAGGGGASAGCAFGPRGQFPGQPCNDTGGNAFVRPRPAQLSLSVDAKNGTLTGAIEFASIAFGQGSRCGKLKIEEGRITGRSLAFTTYKDVNGSRIPARWLGEVTDRGAIVLRTFDTLPCETTPGGFSQLTGRPFLNSGSIVDKVVLVYRRGDDSKKASGPAGKWWSTDSERLTALDLKVGGNGKLSGSVNVCGDSKVKIEDGAVNGRGVTFTTYKKVGPANVAQEWNGDIVNESTLRLASPVTTPCRFASSTTLVFQRSK